MPEVLGTPEMNRCYNMDCMEAMRQMPDQCFDLAVCDPPYFSGPERRGYYGKSGGGIGGRRDYEIAPAWDIPGADYFEQLMRVSKKYIIWGCNYYEFQFPPGRIVWDKCNGNSSFSDCEIAATNCHDSVRLFRFMWNGMMQKVLDAICGLRMEMKDDRNAQLLQRVNQLEMQGAIDRATCGIVRYPMSTAYSAGFNPYFYGGFGRSYGNNCCNNNI